MVLWNTTPKLQGCVTCSHDVCELVLKLLLYQLFNPGYDFLLCNYIFKGLCILIPQLHPSVMKVTYFT